MYTASAAFADVAFLLIKECENDWFEFNRTWQFTACTSGILNGALIAASLTAGLKLPKLSLTATCTVLYLDCGGVLFLLAQNFVHYC